MVKISVLTPSNRKIEGLELVKNALLRQSFRDYEWIIGSPTRPDINTEFIWVEDPPKNEGDYWCLNKLYNKMLLHCNGELVVSIQDFTSFNPTALGKFWFHYEKDPLAIVSGIGDKYASEEFVAKVWQDPRRRDDFGTYYECNPADIEWNFASCPKRALFEVGGFDEELDKYAGMDAYSVMDRLDMMGKYKFYLDQTNESYSLEHGRYKDWEDRNAIHGPYQKRRVFYMENGPALSYI